MRLTSLLFVLPAVLSLTGCGDLYYQTRYIPVSADAAYSVAERSTWSGDREVYELPANPPAIGAEHRERRPCLPPEQRFKPTAMLGIYDETHQHEQGPVTPMAAYGEAKGLPPKPMAAYPISGWYTAKVPGAKEPVGLIPVGVSAKGPYPFGASGRDRSDPPTMAAWRTDETSWCHVDP